MEFWSYKIREFRKLHDNYSMKKFKKPLCRNHQLTNKSLKNTKNEYNHKKGLDEKESSYREGMIKGRIAETLT